MCVWARVSRASLGTCPPLPKLQCGADEPLESQGTQLPRQWTVAVWLWNGVGFVWALILLGCKVLLFSLPGAALILFVCKLLGLRMSACFQCSWNGWRRKSRSQSPTRAMRPQRAKLGRPRSSTRPIDTTDVPKIADGSRDLRVSYTRWTSPPNIAEQTKWRQSIHEKELRQERRHCERN